MSDLWQMFKDAKLQTGWFWLYNIDHGELEVECGSRIRKDWQPVFDDHGSPGIRIDGMTWDELCTVWCRRIK